MNVFLLPIFRYESLQQNPFRKKSHSFFRLNRESDSKRGCGKLGNENHRLTNQEFAQFDSKISSEKTSEANECQTEILNFGFTLSCCKSLTTEPDSHPS